MRRVQVFGTTTATGAGGEIDLRPRERALVAALAASFPDTARRDELIDRLWPDGAPATARKSLHNHVARLREAAGPEFVDTTDDGYRLHPSITIEPEGRGDPLPELDDRGPGVAAARRRLRRERTARRLETATSTTDPLARVGELEVIVEDDPDAEAVWIALADAYAAASRRREAVNCFTRARRMLASAGLTPGDALEDAERSFLNGGTTAVSPANHTPAGRAASSQLRRRDDVVAAVASGPALVVVHGPAGIGKSTVLELAGPQLAAAGSHVVLSRCEPEPVRPLEPISVIVDDLLARYPHLVDELSDPTPLSLLSPELASRVGGDLMVRDPERQRLERSVVELLTHPALQPLVVVVDDLHWSTAATRGFLTAAVRAATAAGRSFSVAAGWCDPKPDELADEAPTVFIEAAGLARDEIRDLVSDRDDADLIAEHITLATGGNPLFVRELVRDGDESGLDALLDDNGGLERVPASITSLLDVRVARLSRRGAASAAAAAILGTRQRIADIEMIAGSGDLDECLREGILRAIDATHTEFDHDLLRRAVLDSLGPVRRIELHDAAARAIESAPSAPERVTEVAHHAVAAGSLDPLGAAHYAQLAAAVHTQQANHAEAAAVLGEAATVLADAARWPARRAELLIDRGAALLRAGDPAARSVFDAALELTATFDDPQLYGRAVVELCRLGPTTEAGANDDAAVAAIDRALALVTEPGLLARVAAAATMVHSMGGEIQRCRELLQLAMQAAEADGRPEILADVLPFSYMTLGEPGDLEQRSTIADRLVEIGTALRRPDVEWEAHQIRFSNSLQIGSSQLRTDLRRLETLAATIQERSREWEMHYLRATVAQIDGRLEESEAIITASLDFADCVAASRVVAVYGVHLLALRLAAGRAAELQGDLQTLADDQPGIGAWHAALAVAAAEAGDEAEARAAFERATADDLAILDRDFSYTGGLYCLGTTAATLGDADLAMRILPHIEPLADRWSWVGTTTLGPMVAPVAGCLDAVGRGDEAARMRAAGRASARILGAPDYELLLADHEVWSSP